MREIVKTVELKPINPDTLRISKVPDSQNYFSVELPMTDFCDEYWKKIFYDKVNTSSTLSDKKLNIQTNWLSIEVVTTPEDIKDTLALIKKMIVATNKEVEKYNEEVEKERQAFEQQERIAEIKIQKMRDILRLC